MEFTPCANSDAICEQHALGGDLEHAGSRKWRGRAHGRWKPWRRPEDSGNDEYHKELAKGTYGIVQALLAGANDSCKGAPAYLKRKSMGSFSFPSAQPVRGDDAHHLGPIACLTRIERDRMEVGGPSSPCENLLLVQW